MTALSEFADFFKARRTSIERYYSDGVGKFAFRVTVDGQTFVCVARTSGPNDGRTSIMNRVAGKAQTIGAYVALMLPGGVYVFDPVTILGHGETDDPEEDDRADRGEKWVSFDLSLGCDFDDWYDGFAEPAKFGEVEQYA